MLNPPNPYESGGDVVRAELVRPKKTAGRILRVMLVSYSILAAFAGVCFVIGGVGHWEILIFALIGGWVTVSGLYQLLNLLD